MSNKNWIQLINRIAREEREESKPCGMVVGKVTNTFPLEIKIRQNHIIPSDFILVTERFEDDINEGDKFILIRQEGGQRYVIMDRI